MDVHGLSYAQKIDLCRSGIFIPANDYVYPFTPPVPPQQRNRKCSILLLNRYPSLAYSVHNDSVYCKVCYLLGSSRHHPCTLENFRDWKNMGAKAKTHFGSTHSAHWDLVRRVEEAVRRQ